MSLYAFESFTEFRLQSPIDKAREHSGSDPGLLQLLAEVCRKVAERVLAGLMVPLSVVVQERADLLHGDVQHCCRILLLLKSIACRIGGAGLYWTHWVR